MSVNLTPAEISDIQGRYRYLVNYQASDPDSPIDPFTYTDSNGDHLLHIAAQRGDLVTVQLLLKAGADVNLTGDMGCTALHYAMQKGNDDVASLLLAYGASASIENDFGQVPMRGDSK